MADRRNFIKKTALSGLGVALGSKSIHANSKIQEAYQMNFASHVGMFYHHAGEDPVSQIKYMADQGITAFEDNGMKARPIAQQEAIANTLQELNMKMGVFVAHEIFWKEPNLASGEEKWRDQFLTEIEESIAVAKRVNATWLTVVPGHLDLRKDIGYQTENVIKTLRMASDILEPAGVVMVLEPLNFRDHPGLFLTKAAQAYQICKAVNSPSCKILFDIYHQQIQEGNLIPNIEKCWDEIAYFQIGDNPGRNEPTTGEINYANVFKYIHEKGFQGILGMEHGNSKPGKAGEISVLDAYRKVDVNG